MKKLLFSMFLIIVFSTSLFAQDKFVKTVTIDSSDYYTAAIQVPTGYALKNILFPSLTSGTTSFKLKVGTEPSDIDTLWYDDAVFSATIPATGCGYALDANLSFGWEYVIILFSTQQTADATIKVVFIKSSY